MRWIFVFKQKTAYEMRISDWSSDVCSSDLCWTPPPRSPARSEAPPNRTRRHRTRRKETTMKITQRVKKILDCYESDNPGSKANLARIPMAGKLGGTGKAVILPVDQVFEHGPAPSIPPNPTAHNPHHTS